MTKIVLGCVLLAAACEAGSLLPASYDLRNGETGSFHYWDDTYTGSGNKTADGALLTGGLGDLTDGVLGNFPPGGFNAAGAVPWVGWLSFNPVITFNFAGPFQFTSVGFFSANPHTGGVALWGSVTLTFSDNGVNFGNPVVYTTSASEQLNITSRFVDVPVNQSARYIRAAFTDSPDTSCGGSPGSGCPWVFISEARFDASVPEPATGWLCISTAILLVLSRKRI